MSSYKCSECNYISVTKGNVKEHIMNVKKCNNASLIEEIVKVACDICNKKFDTESLLIRHKKRCVVKKAVVYEKLNDAGEIKESIAVIMKTLGSMMTENAALVKRIEQLESNVTKGGPKDKKIELEDLEEEEDDDALCEHNKPVEFIPLTYENTVYCLKDCNCEDFNNVKMTVKGQRDYLVEGSVEKHCIMVGDVEYLYQPKGKKLRGKKYTDDLKVKIVKYCYNQKLKGKCYCMGHLNGEE